MTQWGLDTLFNPAKRHMDEEKRRLQSTREEIGDASGGKRIDLESGKVTITRKTRPEDADGDAEPDTDQTAKADTDETVEDESAPAESVKADTDETAQAETDETAKPDTDKTVEDESAPAEPAETPAAKTPRAEASAEPDVTESDDEAIESETEGVDTD